jgi:hypothetical protein
MTSMKCGIAYLGPWIACACLSNITSIADCLHKLGSFGFSTSVSDSLATVMESMRIKDKRQAAGVNSTTQQTLSIVNLPSYQRSQHCLCGSCH